MRRTGDGEILRPRASAQGPGTGAESGASISILTSAEEINQIPADFCSGDPHISALSASHGTPAAPVLSPPSAPAELMHQVHEPIAVPSQSVQEARRAFEHEYQESVENPDAYWRAQGMQRLHWSKPFSATSTGSFENGTQRWFIGGELNACYNAVDRHVPTRGDHPALIWEGDEVGQTKTFTFSELQKEVSKIANVLRAQGVKKGDIVTLFMPMIPELPMTMLACARLGATHSVVFAGFSAEAVRDRIVDSGTKVVVVADEGLRAGKTVKLKAIMDAALEGCPQVNKVLVFKRTGAPVSMHPTRDIAMDAALRDASPDCAPEPMDSSHPLFLLYTSGSTGKPKGLVHGTGGYLTYASLTTERTFALAPDDVMCCAADCGWITGHSYIVYGPLLQGCTTVLFESTPTYPDSSRYFDLIQRTKATQFYTAPTAIRALMKSAPKDTSHFDLSSLRVVGSVGEPINPEAWEWYHRHIGRGHCSVVDTYWQTETGGHLATNQPGVHSMVPGSCSRAALGISLVILDPQTARPQPVDGVAEGVLAVRQGWPGMAMSIFGDHARFVSTYLQPYPGHYFTGDGCRRDGEGNLFITGRVDDVINPSGHRLCTAELEGVLGAVEGVSEAAVVGVPHALKGEGIACFVVLKDGAIGDDAMVQTLRRAIREAVGPFATPDFVVFTDLPKTRSGKIMRRILRKVAAGEQEQLGDVSTLADPTVVPKLIEQFASLRGV